MNLIQYDFVLRVEHNFMLSFQKLPAASSIDLSLVEAPVR